MIRIVVGGQINKQEICAFARKFLGDRATVDVKNDLDAAMAMKSGQYDYYIGACNTGGGGALALAMALLGAPLCQTISMPGRISPDADIIAAVKAGKKAFGFTAQHAEQVLPVLLGAILDEQK